MSALLAMPENSRIRQEEKMSVLTNANKALVMMKTITMKDLTLMDLPNEILIKIIKNITIKSMGQARVDSENIVKLAFVSKSFYSLALPHLYREVKLLETAQIVNFLTTIVNDKTGLANRVETLEYSTLTYLYDPDQRPLKRLLNSHFRFFIELLRKYILRTPRNATRTATFRMLVDLAQGDWDALVAVTLCLLPNLKHIIVRDRGFPVKYWTYDLVCNVSDLDHFDPSIRPLTKVQEVSLVGRNTERPFNYRLMAQWLKLKSVKVLNATDIWGYDPIRTSRRSESITTLNLRDQQDSENLDELRLREILRCFPNLRNFSFCGQYGACLTEQIGHPWVLLLPCLENLRISIDNRPHMPDACIDLSKLPRLTNVHIPIELLQGKESDAATSGRGAWIQQLPRSIETLKLYTITLPSWTFEKKCALLWQVLMQRASIPNMYTMLCTEKPVFQS